MICDELGGENTEPINEFCKNRITLFNKCKVSPSVIDDYNKKKKCDESKYSILKRVCASVLNGGRLKKICEYYGLVQGETIQLKPIQPYLDFLREARRIIVEHPKFKEIVDWKKDDHHKKHIQQRGDEFDIKQYYPPSQGKLLSIILQEYESQIIWKAMETAKNLNCTVTAYTFDGFQVLKNNCNKEQLVTELNKIKPNYVQFKVKAFRTPLPVIPKKDIPTFRSATFHSLNKLSSDDYKFKKLYFERHHFKVRNPVSYYTESGREWIARKRATFKDCYEDLHTRVFKQTLGGGAWVKDRFFQKWEKDEDIRVYVRVECLPPPLPVPSTTYNLWTGFPIEDVEGDWEQADTSIIYKHFDHVSSFDESVKKYLLDWFAHIVQYPAVKTRVCIILRGKQGCGKSAIAEELMKLILGEDKIFITSKSDDIFGRFSDIMGISLIVLNEASGKDTFKVVSILKDRITANVVSREKKGIDTEKNTRVFDNYILTTNTLNPAPTPKDDRRMMAVDCDESIVNNKKYFKPLFSALENPLVMRRFYEDLRNRDISGLILTLLMTDL